MSTAHENEPATKEAAFELEVIRIFEREMLCYIDLLEQIGVRCARLERRIHELEGERHGR